MTATTTADDVARAVAEAWPAARARWSRLLLLRQPIDATGMDTVARIHLGTRQIELDFADIARLGLIDSVEAILAHEVGHHVRYPATLAVDARLRLIERALVPLDGYSTVNLFTDLLINHRLGEDGLAGPLAAVYRSATGQSGPGGWPKDPAFLFYLAIYEELWGLPPGDLMGRGRRVFESRAGRYRADAALLAQNLFGLAPNLYTQFLYFLSVLVAYLRPFIGQEPRSISPYRCAGDEPGPEDWADALVPNAREREAIERALREGWIAAQDGDRLGSLERRIRGLPGQGTAAAEAVPEIMAAYYRREAERYLLRPPPVATLGEAVVPTTTVDWEPGEPVAGVDWTTTLLERGDVLGAALPLVRTRVAEIEGYEVPYWQPRIEIYLDVSGSMPDPRTTLNAMTLAAQILTLGAVRAGGAVRALLYSSGPVCHWEWSRSEIEISRFLMHYVGGGTEFPFDILAASLVECRGRQPVRVVISDHDFDRNVDGAAGSMTLLAEAAEVSPHLVLLLHHSGSPELARYRSAGATVVPIVDRSDFPGLAADLARALFEERPGHVDA